MAPNRAILFVQVTEDELAHVVFFVKAKGSELRRESDHLQCTLLAANSRQLSVSGG